MVSAVFHSPLDATPAGVAQNAMNNVATNALPAGARAQKTLNPAPTPKATTAPGATAPAAPAARDWAALSRSFWLAVLPPLCGLGLLIGALLPAAAADCAKPLYLTFDTGHMGVAPLIAEVLQRQQVRGPDRL